MNIDITLEQEHHILKNVFENFPEASSGMTLRCTKWNYKDFNFEFVDEDAEKTYKINREDARKGLAIYLKLVLLEETSLDANPSNWDADNYDAIVQCTIFGKIVYG